MLEAGDLLGGYYSGSSDAQNIYRFTITDIKGLDLKSALKLDPMVLPNGMD